MSKEKPLPNPHKKPWERAEHDEQLLADKMARAMAEDKLEEFVEKELNGNENARRLAELMMQMTGMAPPSAGSQDREKPVPKQKEPTGKARENQKGAAAKAQKGQNSLDPKVLEQLSRIASENGVTMEWIISRALGLYIRDYRATGRL